MGGSVRSVGLALVRGRSMEPTLRDGDVVLVRYGNRPRAGRLVVVRLAGTLAVKRAGVRDVDGWWVESDNPAAPGAVDSWKLGQPVPAGDVLGTVVARVWPFRRRAQGSVPPDTGAPGAGPPDTGRLAPGRRAPGRDDPL